MGSEFVVVIILLAAAAAFCSDVSSFDLVSVCASFNAAWSSADKLDESNVAAGWTVGSVGSEAKKYEQGQ